MKMVQRVQLTNRKGIEVIVDHLEGELKIRILSGAVSPQIGLVAVLTVANYLKWLQPSTTPQTPKITLSKSHQTTWLDGHKIMVEYQTGSLNELRLTRGEANSLATWAETDPKTFAEAFGEIASKWREISTLIDLKTSYEVEFDAQDAYHVSWGLLETNVYNLSPGTVVKISYEEIGSRCLTYYFPGDKRTKKADPARVGWLASIALYHAIHAGSEETRLLDNIQFGDIEGGGSGITATRNSRK